MSTKCSSLFFFFTLHKFFNIFNPNVENKDGKSRALSNSGDYLDAWQTEPLLNKPVETANVHIKTVEAP